MLEKVKDTLTQFNMIANNDLVVAGVSGGADSVALLLNLCEYRKYVEFELKVVHLNHLIREDASKDAEFVEELCRQLKLEFHLFEIDVEKRAAELHFSTEEAGRMARYEAMRSLNPDKIAVGHHEDDQAETVLLNMSRGSGLHGMKGISPIQGEIIRPLLFISRKEIEDYLEELCQPYQTDSTNLTTDYVRNRIRHKVIPVLQEEINDKSVAHIASMAADMWELERYIRTSVLDLYNKLCQPQEDKSQIYINLKQFKALDPYISRELLLYTLEQLTPKRKDITRSHIMSILKLCHGEGEKSLDLPYDLEVLKSYDSLLIRKRKKATHSKLSLTISKEQALAGHSLELYNGQTLSFRVLDADPSMIIKDKKYTKWLDYDKISCSLIIRNRQEGDYLTINDKGQKKSLKDYMINEKIPKEKRDELMLIADGSHVIWLPAYRISAYYKIDNSTKKILEISLSNTD